MRLSEFGRAVADEFGPRGDSLVEDLALAPLGYRTAARALSDGVPPRDVWMALCDATDVSPARRHGVGLIDANKNTL
ncbi:DUF3046 domain-containing protein [Microbacterium sp.]|uniref:DUF3046 domain-containing protein n=1 Tax=Microbacterium sp. TaxID=51671 RepID=UPI0025E1E670|nr:DUF3046 domain-containing protein [Microbacterium sp.]